MVEEKIKKSFAVSSCDVKKFKDSTLTSSIFAKVKLQEQNFLKRKETLQE
jgi:hypothetical protein